MKDLLERLNILIGKLKLLIKTQNLTTSQGQRIYESAKKFIGTDASPHDIAPDELGCAESVTEILRNAGFKMPVIISTIKLHQWFKSKTEWLEVDTPIEGDIIISPTGMGGKNGITNGHVGIVGAFSVVMSNASSTGTFEPNYTIKSWYNRYSIKGGYPVYYFRRVL